MPVPLASALAQRWADYLALENAGTRDTRNAALGRFIDALLLAPPAERKAWALDLAARVVDAGEGLPVRQPLFERVVLPALAEGFAARSPGCARWLAALSNLPHRLRGVIELLGDDQSTETALLRAAVAHDPADARSRRRLIELLDSQLDYSLHELPTGVLYGTDGATADQCTLLLAEVDEFAALLAADGRPDAFADLVANCRFHFAAYRRYLLTDPGGGSYARFLDRHPGG